MVIVISPAKSLDFEKTPCTDQFTQSDFLEHSEELMENLRTKSTEDLSKLMSISAKLADLNYDRNQNWKRPFQPDNAKQAVLAFKGDVYVGLDAETYTQADFDYAQQHLRILSGLYGLLRPLDLIQPYRLEMGTKLQNKRGKNLYQFWDDRLTNSLNELLATQDEKVLINLASNEYFKAVQKKKLNATIITPIFKDFKNGQYKVISFLAKKARGWMSSYIIKNKLESVEAIKGFDVEGYAFKEDLSSETEWVFTRG